MKDLQIIRRKDVWVVWTNTDLTEGKGHQFPLYICELESTALRLAKKEGVQGSNASIAKDTAFLIRVRPNFSRWYVPGVIKEAGNYDKDIEREIELVDKAIQAAKDAGLNDDHIEIMRRSRPRVGTV